MDAYASRELRYTCFLWVTELRARCFTHHF
jgi:hypothetical protein